MSGFGKITDEAEIAFWTGVLGAPPIRSILSSFKLKYYQVATFFLTQFLTSLLWVRYCMMFPNFLS